MFVMDFVCLDTRWNPNTRLIILCVREDSFGT